MEYLKIIASLITMTSALVLVITMPSIFRQILHNENEIGKFSNFLSFFPNKLYAIFSISTIMLVAGKLGISLAINKAEITSSIYAAFIILSFIIYVLMSNKKFSKTIRYNAKNNVSSFNFRFKNMMYLLSILTIASIVFLIDAFILFS